MEGPPVPAGAWRRPAANRAAVAPVAAVGTAAGRRLAAAGASGSENAGLALRVTLPSLVALFVGRSRRSRRRGSVSRRSAATALEQVLSARLSPDSVVDFYRCRKLFGLRHVQKEAPSAAADPTALAGRLVRQVLGKLLDLPAAERSLERAEELAGAEVKALVRAHRPPKKKLDAYCRLVNASLDAYFKLEDPTEVEPMLLQKSVLSSRKNKRVPMQGVIDRLDIDIASDGKDSLTVVRYSMAGHEPTPADVLMLKMQALLVQDSFEAGELKGRILCLGGGGREKVVTLSSLDLDEAFRAANHVFEELRMTAATEEAIFLATLESGCHSCAYRSQCPAFKASPPERPPEPEEVVDELLQKVKSRTAQAQGATAKPSRSSTKGATTVSTAAKGKVPPRTAEAQGATASPDRSSTEGVTTVSTAAEAEVVLRKLMTLTEEGRYHAVDTETKDWDPELPVYNNGKIICFSIYCGDDVDFGNGPRLWVDNMDLDGNLTGVLDCFKEYLEDPRVKKVFHNYSFDRAMFYNSGINIGGFAGDTMHMARLEHSDRMFYSLAALGEELVGAGWGKQDLTGVMKAQQAKLPEDLHLSESEETREAWVEYSTFDTVATWKLHERLSQLLGDRPWHPPDLEQPCGTMLDFYQKYWAPFGDVLAAMESRGVPVDVDVLAEGEAQAKKDLETESDAFIEWVKSEYKKRYSEHEDYERMVKDLGKFNPTSIKQLTSLLFKDHPTQPVAGVLVGGLGLPVGIVNRRTPSGRIALGGHDLMVLTGKDPARGAFGTAKPFIGEEGCIGLYHRCQKASIDKALSSFLIPLPTKVSGEGRLHATFNLHTSTGRLSSRHPNLQQLPALDRDRYHVRNAIKCVGSRRFIVADYGQLDIRILAHLSKCTTMIAALKSGADFHSQTAVSMYEHVRGAVQRGEVALEKSAAGDCSIPLVKDKYPTERRHAKAVNFGIAYGLTATGLSAQLECTQQEAQEMIDRWHKAYPEVMVWQQVLVQEAQKCDPPVVPTLRGRQRRIDALEFYNDRSGKGWRRAVNTPYADRFRGMKAQRMAINAPVQGGSADVVVEAMLKAHESPKLRDLGYFMVLQVHDELVFEGPGEHAKEALAVVRDIMESPFLDDFQLEVPLPVDAQITRTWGEAKG